MEIMEEIKENSARFFIEEKNECVAELSCKFRDKTTLLITHTEVNDSLGGKGIGEQLVSAAVNYARQNGYVVKATCSYANAVPGKTVEYADVYVAEKNHR